MNRSVECVQSLNCLCLRLRTPASWARVDIQERVPSERAIFMILKSIIGGRQNDLRGPFRHSPNRQRDARAWTLRARRRRRVLAWRSSTRGGLPFDLRRGAAARGVLPQSKCPGRRKRLTGACVVAQALEINVGNGERARVSAGGRRTRWPRLARPHATHRSRASRRRSRHGKKDTPIEIVGYPRRRVTAERGEKR